MNAPVVLLPPSVAGRRHHLPLDPDWARHTTLPFARTLCGLSMVTPAGRRSHGVRADMFPELCTRCAARAETSTVPVEAGRATNGLAARPAGTQETR